MSDMFFYATEYSLILSDKEAWVVPMKCFWREGYGHISGGMRVLGLEADNREASPRKGARSTSTSAAEVEQAHQGG
jgi:hypothetical protein